MLSQTKFNWMKIRNRKLENWNFYGFQAVIEWNLQYATFSVYALVWMEYQNLDAYEKI